MDLYLHDSAGLFLIKLGGRLEGPWVSELEHAWITARSALGSKALVVDVSALSGADRAGVELLLHMRETGAQLCAAAPVSADLMRLLGIAAPVAETVPAGGFRRRAFRLLSGWRGPRARRCAPRSAPPVEA